MFFIRLFLANTWEKNRGVTVLVSSQTAVKGGPGFEILVRMDSMRGGNWGKIQNFFRLNNICTVAIPGQAR